MAQFTEAYVVVYQAYRPAIGLLAAENQFFGGEFSYSRMSWIKPNFLWMMYRSGWGQKEGQEITLAIKLKRDYFDSILENAVVSRYEAEKFASADEWKEKLNTSSVRLQWDPDHSPQGEKEERRAIQLGLRNEFLLPFRGEGIVEIEDITAFVVEQRQFALPGQYDKLCTPLEKVYTPIRNSIVTNIGLDEI